MNTDAELREMLAHWESKLPVGVSMDDLVEMAKDAISRGVGLTWIPYFCGEPSSARGRRLVFEAAS